jgi:hypothetical protein
MCDGDDKSLHSGRPFRQAAVNLQAAQFFSLKTLAPRTELLITFNMCDVARVVEETNWRGKLKERVYLGGLVLYGK